MLHEGIDHLEDPYYVGGFFCLATTTQYCTAVLYSLYFRYIALTLLIGDAEFFSFQITDERLQSGRDIAVVRLHPISKVFTVFEANCIPV